MAKLLKKLKQKILMWDNIGNVQEYHTALDKLDASVIAQLLDKKIPGSYRDSASIWDSLSENSNLADGNSLKNRTWLYTVWLADRRNVRTSYKSAQKVDDLLQLNEGNNDKDLNDVSSKSNKVLLPNFS